MGLLRDLRLAVRTLARSPGFAVAALVTLGLTTGLNAAVFTLVNALLFRPLPVAAPEELLRIYSRVPGELMSHAPMSSADWVAVRRECRSFEAVAASFLTTGALDDGERGRLVVIEPVSGDYFTTLGVGAALGRTVVRGDARPARARSPWGGESVAVLSHTAWRRRFGSDPGIVGRTLRLNGHPLTVVGVAPPGFFGLARGVSPELWLPMGEPGPPTRAERERRSLWLVGRLTPGATPGAARAELAALAGRLRRTYPDTHAERGFAALPSSQVRLLPGLDPVLYPAAMVVLGVVGLSLLIANSNLAQLLLVRGLERRREIAIRLSLGAPRMRLVRSLLSEGLVLSLGGGLLGLGLAAVTPRLMEAWTAALPVDVALGLALDRRVVLFTLGLPILTTLAFATAPALEATRPALLASLRQGEFGGAPARHRLRRGLVAAQLALAFLALFCAGGAITGLVGALEVDPGFESRDAAVVSIAPHMQGYTPAAVRALEAELLEQLRRRSGVVAAGFASHLPLTVELLYERVAPARGEVPESEWPLVDTAVAGPGYLEALGARVLRGRTFREADGARRTAVVNQTLAARLWPGEDPVGKTLFLAGSEAGLEVVGVVADGRYRSLVEAPRPFLFQSASGERRPGHAGEVSLGTRTLVVRSRGGEARARAALAAALARVAPDLVPLRLTGLADATRLPGLLPRALASLLSGIAGVALLLVVLGVAGVAAYAASRRRHEIGVRMALGAQPADIRRLLLREAVGIATLGIGVGAALSAALARPLASILTAGEPLPTVGWLAVALLLAALVAAAGLVPARRASRADPLRSLRED